MSYLQSVYDPALGTEYSSGYLEIENVMIKLSAYNYKHYKNTKKNKIKKKPGHWSRAYKKLRARF